MHVVLCKFSSLISKNTVYLLVLREKRLNCIPFPEFPTFFAKFIFGGTQNETGYHKIVITGLVFLKKGS